MIRNDYRRAFIMLRPARQGYAGHVRLEKRTLAGNLYFIVTAPEGAGPLRAALAGQRDGQYYATPLGELARDRRGQLTLAWAFDPRAIDGRPLEAYAWVAVADVGSGCSVALVGNVEGSREVDPAALERAVCALFTAPNEPAPIESAPDEPAADVPAPDEPPAAPMTVEDAMPEPESDVKIYTRVRHARAAQPPEAPAATETTMIEETAETVEAEASAANDEVVESAANAEAGKPAEDAKAEASAEPAPTYVEPQTAAGALGLDISKPWIEPAENLRRLFATQAPLKTPLGDGYTYVPDAAPAPGGQSPCLAGLKAEGGQITGIRCAVPGQFSPEPPAGLDDYAWNPAGYWVLDIGIS